MELLVVTLAHLQNGGYEDTVSRLRFIVDTVKNAPGMINARLYCGKEGEGSCLLLTTWEDEESWQRAQERYNPGDLLLRSMGDILNAMPEQWLMEYVWGYSRPGTQPFVAEAHLATIQPDAADHIAQQWLDELRRQAASPVLTFAFLARRARSKAVETSYPAPGMNGALTTSGYTYLSVLSWPGEAQRKEFYADQRYKALQNSFTKVGMVRVVSLLPL